VRSSVPFFRLQYPQYAKWIDPTWVSDCWKFAHRARIVIDIEKHWIPTIPRERDIAIMDMALTFQLDVHQLCRINTCRLYLQAASVSDLAMARGDKLLLSVLAGERDQHHHSGLHWPHIPRPPESFWYTWRLFLQYFTRGRKLMTPLGVWINYPHRTWKWFQTPDKAVWEKIGEEEWMC
jgi:hypothetical protein